MIPIFPIVPIVLAAVCVLAAIVVPAWLLWRIKRDLRLPLAWVAVAVILLGLAAAGAHLQLENIPTPAPIHETLTGITDRSGLVAVTGLRLASPMQREARIEVDVENAGSEPVSLGVQYVAGGGSIGGEADSPGSAEGAVIHRVEPEWSGTIAYDVILPAFASGGSVVIVIARCPNVDSAEELIQLPPDSEALYQQRFVLVPDAQ